MLSFSSILNETVKVLLRPYTTVKLMLKSLKKNGLKIQAFADHRSKSAKRNFNVSSLEVQQIEAAVLLRSKDVVAILPTDFDKSLIYQLCAMTKEMQIMRKLFSLYR